MQSTSPSSYAFKSYFICTNEITQNNYLSSSTTGPTILQLPISPPSSTEQQMMTPAASSQNPSSCEEERAYETPPTPTATRITRIIKSDAYFWVTDLIFLFFCETLTFSASPNKKSGKKKKEQPSFLSCQKRYIMPNFSEVLSSKFSLSASSSHSQSGHSTL